MTGWNYLKQEEFELIKLVQMCGNVWARLDCCIWVKFSECCQIGADGLVTFSMQLRQQETRHSNSSCCCVLANLKINKVEVMKKSCKWNEWIEL